MAHDVFISYASDDKPIADAVCAALEARRIRCWIAPRDVLPGRAYAEALIEAIDEASLMVLVFSSNANNSPHVMREVERSASKGIPIVPFRIEDVPPSTSMEYYISSTHWLDALSSPMQKHLQHLADTVESLSAKLKQDAPAENGHPTKDAPSTADGSGDKAARKTHEAAAATRKPWYKRWIPYTVVLVVGVVAVVVALVLTETGGDEASPASITETSLATTSTAVSSSTTTVASSTATASSSTTTSEAPPDVYLGIDHNGREVSLGVGDRVRIDLSAVAADKITSVEWNYETLILRQIDVGTNKVSGFVTESWLELETLGKGAVTVRAVYEHSNGTTKIPWAVYLLVTD